MSLDYKKQRHLPNHYPNFTSENSIYVTSTDISSDIAQKIDKAEKALYQRILDSDRQVFGHNYTVYVGSCGIALLYLLKYTKYEDNEALLRGKKIVTDATENLKKRGISFLQGDAGPLALGFLFGAYASGNSSPTDLSRRLCTLADQDSESPYELLNGRVGYLYALLFVRKHFPNVISDDLLRKQMSIILQAGVKRAEITPCKAPLAYEWYDTNYLGAAHGVAGILYILLCVFNSPRYLEVALQLGEIVWEKGLLSKGYSICHGVSGNAYVFLELFKTTKDMKHLHRAACFAEWCTHHPRDEYMKPDRPLSMFEGLAGLVYFLNDIRKPLNACFPAYGL